MMPVRRVEAGRARENRGDGFKMTKQLQLVARFTSRTLKAMSRATMALLSCLCLCLCLWLCGLSAHAQHGRLPVPFPTPTPTPMIRGGDPDAPNDANAPTMRKPTHVEIAPSHQRRSYDAAHDTTYLNVDIPIVTHTERKARGGALAFAGRDLTVVFQLAYEGQRTDDLKAAYLVFESTTAPDEPADRLSGATHLDLRADAYEYAYDRADYKTGVAEQAGAAGRDAPALRREAAIFRLEVSDLTEISAALRVELKLGAETYTLKSMQLAGLHRALVTGDKQ